MMSRAGNERAQKRTHQKNIHHGHFIDDERQFQRVILCAGEIALLAAVFQQAVERLGLHAAGLAHALGGAAGRRPAISPWTLSSLIMHLIIVVSFPVPGPLVMTVAAGDGGFDGLTLLRMEAMPST